MRDVGVRQALPGAAHDVAVVPFGGGTSVVGGVDPDDTRDPAAFRAALDAARGNSGTLLAVALTGAAEPLRRMLRILLDA